LAPHFNLVNRHLILATAGHVDHGKSSLVKALTGTDPDRLPEEKARGITIDLGFACLDLPAATGSDSIYRLGIVDVPGHEDFVKNMVAGVGSVDIALLVVAADDGWMPQTEEHLQILIYLGVTRLVVALTKIDLPEVNTASLCDSVRRQLRQTPFASAPVVPVSTVTQIGIDHLKAALASVLSDALAPKDIAKPRLAVDRAFTLRGIGTVVTGTLTGGTLNVGQSVVIQPLGHPARIRSIQSHNRDQDSVGPGTRVALNLSDVAVANNATTQAGVRRGHVVTLGGFGPPVSFLDVLLNRSGRLEQNHELETRALNDGARVRVHHGSGNWVARVRLGDNNPVGAGESALARLCFETPIFAFVNDRFIVRDWAEQVTLAGGTVLAEAVNAKPFRDPVHRVFLQRCAAGIDSSQIRVAAQIERDGLIRRFDLLAKSHFSVSEIDGALAGLAREGKVLLLGELVADLRWWTALSARAVEAVDSAHKSHPEWLGLPIAQLRSDVRDSLLLPGAFEALLSHLLMNGFAQAGTVIKRQSHRPALPTHLQATGAKLRTRLELKPFEPPSRNELAPDANTRQALRFLIETHEVVELSTETVMSQDAFSRASRIIEDFLIAHRSGTVSELRQAVGAPRRIMVPLLERLDHSGLTVRQGDIRVLRAGSGDASRA
jgi:selenocysteine-specific elongation factor